MPCVYTKILHSHPLINREIVIDCDCFLVKPLLIFETHCELCIVNIGIISCFKCIYSYFKCDSSCLKLGVLI